jgi:lipopolysaccharide transport system ATP-binding protein
MDDVAREGRTVLFVSHNLTAIESLCERALWMDRGEIVADGSAGDTISRYLRAAVESNTSRTWDDPATAPGGDSIKLRSARAYPMDGTPSDPITVRTAVVLEFAYQNLRPGAFLNLSLHVYTADGVLLFNAVPVNEEEWYGRAFPAGVFRDRCFIPADLLNDGGYRVELLVVKDQRTILYEDSAILEFDVQDVAGDTGVFEGEWRGLIRPALEWRTEFLD